MPLHDDRGSRRRRSEPYQQRLLEMAIAMSLSLKWREKWRTEQAGKAKQQRDNGSATPQLKRVERVREPSDAASFAAAIARAEFGRFYWSDKAERQAKAARPQRKSGDPNA